MANRDDQTTGAVVNGRTVTAWCLYDWANSAFATTVMAAMFPPFFRQTAMAAGLAGHEATAWWGYITAFALLLIALTAPVLGAVADQAGSRKRFLASFAGIGIAFTLLLVTIGPGQWRWAAVLYIGANLGFAGSIVFYESLLPHVAAGRDIDRISTRGYALGYAGGGLLLLVNAAWIMRPGWFGMPDTVTAVKVSFASVAIWWAVFSLPLLRRVPEPPAPGGRVSLADGFLRLRTTFREIRRYRQLVLFLVAYWIYSDGIGTIVKMATAYGSEIGIGMGDLVAALVLTQLIGLPSTLAFGRAASRLGARPSLLAGLAVYAAICTGGYFLRTPLHFFLLAGVVGLVQGGTQALSRSLYATLVPKHKTGEFFGFFATSGRFAGIVGPLMFGLLSHATGQSRVSILLLVPFFVVGGLVLSRVDLAAGRAAAEESERSFRTTVAAAGETPLAGDTR